MASLSGVTSIEELIQMFQNLGYNISKDKPKDVFRKSNRDAKFVRQLEVFGDDPKLEFKTWLFDLKVVLSSVDPELGDEVGKLLRYEHLVPEPPDVKDVMPTEVYDKYAAELCGVICQLTKGEAKNLVKGVLARV